MKALYYVFGFLTAVVVILWTQAQRPLPQPALVPIEVTRVVVQTPVPLAPLCLAGVVTFANVDGELRVCPDNRYFWRAR